MKIPIKTIPRKKREDWYSIKPYKKEKDFHGEIRLSCFVSEFKSLPHSEMSTNSGSTEDILSSEKKKGIFHGGSIHGKLLSATDTPGAADTERQQHTGGAGGSTRHDVSSDEGMNNYL